MDPELMIPLAGMALGLVAIYTSHQRKVLEMRLRMQQEERGRSDSGLSALRDEVGELRDTATRYDISFDTALQRIESRVSNLEQRLLNQPQDAGASAAPCAVQTPESS